MAADPKPLAESLRKLAAAYRERDAAEKTAQFKTSAHVMRAAKGLTILREKVRS